MFKFIIGLILVLMPLIVFGDHAITHPGYSDLEIVNLINGKIRDHAKTTISIELPGTYGKNRLELRIINILGQTIKTYHPKSGEKLHRMKITWDGCDESAQPVGSGVYFVLARSGDSVKSLKMTLLR